ncbi:MAG: HAMP domain-containing histidine kinase [Eubacteriales bacterium]|nr:HAMP domain-containing histidine kinase [Eubacteriales bacterium]
MKNNYKELREARHAEARRRKAERIAAQAQPDAQKLRHVFTHPRRWLRTMLSNLRFSLTLRIALHYSIQLFKTTFLILLVFTIVYATAQIPSVNATLDTLAALAPADGEVYSAQQLVGLPLNGAYLLPEPLPTDAKGFFASVRLAFSDVQTTDGYQLLLYRDTVHGGLVAAFSLTYVLYVYTLLFWTLVCCDLFRVVYFMRGKHRLNNAVLKPISEMTEAAATLSANNLSNRINIAGTKNELKDLATVINGMLDRIERSYNSQKQFVSDASHELRTPIAVIQGYASMLERWGKTDKAVLDEGITAISQETASMKELVERLLFLARHDKKTLMLEMEVFDPAEIMSSVHRDAQLLSSAHEFVLLPLAHCSVNGDKGMLKQLMRILVDNAIKYTPPGGKITLGMTHVGQECVLSVQDTGPGISAQELPRIFDRFYRSDSARKAQSSGHGLGLSIARIIVVAHGGKMTVRSKEGTGTTFRVRLPMVDIA